MVECNKCQDWFHYICINENPDTDPALFVCPTCKVKDPDPDLVEFNISKEEREETNMQRLGITKANIEFDATLWMYVCINSCASLLEYVLYQLS